MTKSLRLRLQLWYGSVLTLSLLLFASLVYWRAHRDLHDRAVRQAVNAAEYLIVSLRPPGRPYAPPPLIDHHPPRGLRIGEPPGRRNPLRPPLAAPPDIPPSLLNDPPPPQNPDSPGDPQRPAPPQPTTTQLNYVVWYPDGRRTQNSPDSPAELEAIPKPAPGPTLEVQRQPARVRVVRRGPGGLVVLVDRPLTEDLTDLHLFGASVAVLGAAALTVSLAGGHWVSGRIIQPITLIAETAQQISAAELHRRIPSEQLDAELRPLADVLNDTFARLERSFHRLNQFTADASHELRTPLAVIQSQTELALQQTRSPEEYREALETCLKSANRMRSLTDSLLLLARSDAAPTPRPAEPTDLRTAVEEAAATLQDRFNHAEIELDCETPERPVLVSADHRLLRQIALNLLENAAQHTPPAGSVSIKVLIQSTSAQLIVHDNGCGIPAEHLPHIFERFYRIDTARSRSTGGSGLGLAICRSLAEAHGGTIHCSSTPEIGTTLTVQLPLAQSPPEASHT